MERRYIPIEAFLKPCLSEWIEFLLSSNPQHPLLRRIRDREQLSETDQDGLVCSIMSCNHGAIFRNFYTKDLLEYTAFLLDVDVEDINSISIGSHTYSRDDFEGAFSETKERVLGIFGEQGILSPFSIRRKASRMCDALSTRIPEALRRVTSDPSSPDDLREILGRCRTDFEELIKHLAHFVSLATGAANNLPIEFEALSGMDLSRIISRLVSANLGLNNIEDKAMEKMSELQAYISAQLTTRELDELCSLHGRFKRTLPRKPYKLDALREFGNIFHHEAVDHRHINLVRKYLDLAGTFLHGLVDHLPTAVSIIGVEHRADNSVIIRAFESDENRFTEVLYTAAQLRMKYKSLWGKRVFQEQAVQRNSESLLTEAFLFPATYRNSFGKQICFPIITERKVLIISKATLIRAEVESRLRVEVEVQMPNLRRIKTVENVQE